MAEYVHGAGIDGATSRWLQSHLDTPCSIPLVYLHTKYSPARLNGSMAQA
jgi:hypothetical protein